MERKDDGRRGLGGRGRGKKAGMKGNWQSLREGQGLEAPQGGVPGKAVWQVHPHGPTETQRTVPAKMTTPPSPAPPHPDFHQALLSPSLPPRRSRGLGWPKTDYLGCLPRLLLGLGPLPEDKLVLCCRFDFWAVGLHGPDHSQTLVTLRPSRSTLFLDYCL